MARLQTTSVPTPKTRVQKHTIVLIESTYLKFMQDHIFEQIDSVLTAKLHAHLAHILHLAPAITCINCYVNPTKDSFVVTVQYTLNPSSVLHETVLHLHWK